MIETTEQPATPKRTRRRRRMSWTRLFCNVLTTLILLGIVGHALWSYLETRAVDRRVAALRAAGEPVLPADFTPSDPTGADNAGVDFDAAAAMLDQYGHAHREL